MTFLDDAIARTPGLKLTTCLVCSEETLYAAHCARDGPRCMGKRGSPKTCGRLACMVSTEEMEAVS